MFSRFPFANSPGFNQAHFIYPGAVCLWFAHMCNLAFQNIKSFSEQFLTPCRWAVGISWLVMHQEVLAAPTTEGRNKGQSWHLSPSLLWLSREALPELIDCCPATAKTHEPCLQSWPALRELEETRKDESIPNSPAFILLYF